MAWWSMFGKGNPISDTVKEVANGLDGLFTSDDERLTHAEVMERLKQEPAKAQVSLNAIEAQHRSIFVAGWRPFTGWVCGLALAYQYLLNPILAWAVTIVMEVPVYPPSIDMAVMMPVLLGMLGLGGMRSFEKKANLTK